MEQNLKDLSVLERRTTQLGRASLSLPMDPRLVKHFLLWVEVKEVWEIQALKCVQEKINHLGKWL